jgi:hypothetical protein
MPNRLSEWLVQIKMVEREWFIARLALDRFQKDVSTDPTLLPDPLRNRDVHATRERLEGTYLIRLFAEFETGVRSFWRTLRRSRPQTKALLDSVGAQRSISFPTVDAVQQVRMFRNSLVHEKTEQVETVTLADARKRLCTYFSFLPFEW